MKNIFKLTSLYVGLIIGAGFASGREILTYFTVYGSYRNIALLFSGSLFCAIGIKLLLISYTKKTDSYTDFIKNEFGEGFGKFISLITGLFLIAVYSAMIASFGAVSSEIFNLKSSTGAMFGSILCAFIFLFGSRGVVFINSLLTPFIVIFLIFVFVFSGIKTASVFSVLNIKQVITSAVNGTGSFTLIRSLISAFIYVSYNIITAAAVLMSVRRLLKNRRTAIISGLMGGIILTFLGFFMSNVLFPERESLKIYSLPFLFAIKNNPDFVILMYKIALIFAILTTAVGNGHSASEWLSDNLSVNKYLCILFVVVFGFFSSFIGFSAFVSKVYFMFGILGAVLTFKILFVNTSEVKKIRHR